MPALGNNMLSYFSLQYDIEIIKRPVTFMQVCYKIECVDLLRIHTCNI